MQIDQLRICAIGVKSPTVGCIFRKNHSCPECNSIDIALVEAKQREQSIKYTWKCSCGGRWSDLISYQGSFINRNTGAVWMQLFVDYGQRPNKDLSSVVSMLTKS